MIYKNFNILFTKIKKNPLLSDSLWSLLGNVIGKGLALLAGIFVARFLGKDEFGEYGIIRNTILTISIFSTFGLGYTATKFISEYKNESPEKLRLFIKYATYITLTFSGVMSFGLFVFANLISVHFLNSIELALPLRILSILIVFNALSTTQIGFLAGLGKFKEISKINSLIGIITFFISIIMTYFWKLNGALLALLLVQILNCIFNYLTVRKALPKPIVTGIKDRLLLKKIIHFSTPIALQELTYSAGSWITSIMLIKLSNYGELGIYSAAMQWYAIILFIPGILRNVILSHLSEQVNNVSKHSKILKQTISINVIFTFIPSIFVYLFSGLIAKSYGQNFSGVQSIISIAVFTSVFSSINNVFAQAYTSKGKNWIMLFFRAFTDLSILGLFIVLINYSKLNGAMSLVISNLVCGILLTLIVTYYYYFKLNQNYQSFQHK